jgi:hypothetical protein
MDTTKNADLTTIAKFTEPRRAPTIADVLHSRKHRVDGWTPVKVAAFIEQLAETGNVTKAAAYVRMTTASCYTLRNHPDGGPFAEAWNTAISGRYEMLLDIAIDRVREGTEVARWWKGELVGRDRVFSDRLLMFMLSEAHPDRARAKENPGQPATGDAAATSLPAAARAGLIGWSDDDGTDEYELEQHSREIEVDVLARCEAARVEEAEKTLDIAARTDEALGRTRPEGGWQDKLFASL